MAVGTPRMLAEALFGARPAAEALIAERGGRAVGFALYFTTFSTFLCKPGLYLEDLFVEPAHRGAGIGKALLRAPRGARGRARLRALRMARARLEHALDPLLRVPGRDGHARVAARAHDRARVRAARRSMRQHAAGPRRAQPPRGLARPGPLQRMDAGELRDRPARRHLSFLRLAPDAPAIPCASTWPTAGARSPSSWCSWSPSTGRS